ncbi:MAG: hypothetical protein K9G33_03800 [Sneathiella sp.]|nr:hypothetical protein [Sneathiella sp.]
MELRERELIAIKAHQVIILGLFWLDVLSGFDIDYLNRYFSEKTPRLADLN